MFSFFAVVLLLLMANGCAKEYSYEQKPVDTTAVPVNVPGRSALYSCPACLSPDLPDSSWRFTIGNVTYCGHTENAVILQQRTSFTFFGPSACSADSGFVATIRLTIDTLNRDNTDVKAKMTCYYYDKVTPSYMFMSDMGDYLFLTITRYSHQRKEASGTFGGIVVMGNGERKELKDGRFRIHF